MAAGQERVLHKPNLSEVEKNCYVFLNKKKFCKILCIYNKSCCVLFFFNAKLLCIVLLGCGSRKGAPQAQPLRGQGAHQGAFGRAHGHREDDRAGAAVPLLQGNLLYLQVN